MSDLGFEYYTEQTADTEYHAYFYRKEIKNADKDIPMRPAALTNMPLIDEGLGKVAFFVKRASIPMDLCEYIFHLICSDRKMIKPIRR